MKTLFQTIAVACAALFIGATSVSAQQEPSKSEIRATVTEHLDNMYAYYNTNMAGTYALECWDLFEYREMLDKKGDKVAQKATSKWLKQHKDSREAMKHYTVLSLGVVYEVDIEELDTKEAIQTYYDAIYSLKHAGYDDAANIVAANYYVFLYARGCSTEHATNFEAYNEAYPNRHKVVSAIFEDEEVVAELKNWYEEDFESMSQWDLINSYIDHLDAIGNYLAEGDMMEVTRHTIVMGNLTKMITDSETLDEAIRTWFTNDEYAEITTEYFDK